MTKRRWFSAKLRMVIITKRGGWRHYSDSLFVLKAPDFERAFERALRLGKDQERSYTNALNDIVSVRFKEILTLDIVRSASPDGAEVFHASADIPRRDRGKKIAPEMSQPDQTI